MKLCIADIISATGGKLISGNLNMPVKNISTDTRKIAAGSFFIALRGDKFDGNDYIVEASKRGAVGCLTEKDITSEEFERIEPFEFAVIKVGDTLQALARIAAAYRRMFEGRVVAVTGSVGKTSIKDMTASVLSEKFSVHKTQGNFNNEIGMPMTILGLSEEHMALVVEMGMRSAGEIDYLAGIAKPDVGIISNIGVSHIEYLGSRENIFNAKMELAPHIKQGGFLVLNGDDEFLNKVEKYDKLTVMKYGINNKETDVYGDNIIISDDGENISFELHIKNIPCEIYNVKLGVPGKHNVYNALCAVCAGLIFQMKISDIIDGIGKYRAPDMRQDIRTSEKGYKIINDAYNASPDSMRAAIDMLDGMKCGGKKIAVLGNMSELGEGGAGYHREIGEYFSNSNIDMLITVGDLAKNIAEAAGDKEKVSFDTAANALEFIKNNIENHDIILIKASRIMKLDELASSL